MTAHESGLGDPSLGRSVMSFTLASTMVNLVNLGVLAILARIISVAEMGVVVSVGLVLAVASVIPDLGTAQGILSLVADPSGAPQNQRVYATIGIALKAFASLVFGLTIMLLAGHISVLITGTLMYEPLFQIVSFVAILSPLNATIGQVYLGLQRVTVWSGLQVASTVTGALVTAVSVLSGAGPLGLVYGYLTRDAFLCIVSMVDLTKKKVLGLAGISGKARATVSRIIRTSGILFFASLAGLITNWYDRAFLLTRFSLEDAAVYGIAASLYSAIALAPSAFGPPLFSAFSRSFKAGEGMLKSNIESSIRIVTFAMSLVMIAGAAFSQVIVPIVAGPRYSGSILPLTVLMISGYSLALAISTTGVLVIKRAASRQALCLIASAIVGIALSIILSPVMSPLTMSFLRALTTGFSSIGVFILARRYVGFDSQMRHIISQGVLGVGVFGAAWLMLSLLGSTLPVSAAVGALSILLYLILTRTLKTVRARDIRTLEYALGPRYRLLVNVARKLLVGKGDE